MPPFLHFSPLAIAFGTLLCLLLLLLLERVCHFVCVCLCARNFLCLSKNRLRITTFIATYSNTHTHKHMQSNFIWCEVLLFIWTLWSAAENSFFSYHCICFQMQQFLYYSFIFCLFVCYFPYVLVNVRNSLRPLKIHTKNSTHHSKH